MLQCGSRNSRGVSGSSEVRLVPTQGRVLYLTIIKSVLELRDIMSLYCTSILQLFNIVIQAILCNLVYKMTISTSFKYICT